MWNFWKMFTLLTSLALTAVAHTDAVTSHAPAILVHSDRAQVFFDQQSMLYIGHVSLVQGDRRIGCETLMLQANHSGHVILVQANGTPATFSGEIERNNPQVVGHADTLLYQPQSGALTLTGNAMFEQGGDSFSGEQLIYDMKDRIVRATKSLNRKTQLIIQPH